MNQTHTPGGEWTPARILHLAEASEVEYAVRACNTHGDLVAALRALLENNLGPQVDDGAEWDACCDMAKAALAKAGEK